MPRRAHSPFRGVLAAVGAAAVLVSVIPAVNLARGVSRELPLYDIGFALPAIGRLLTPLGISTAPRKVVMGRDGWMFLGDDYADVLSMKRRPPSPADEATARRIAQATRAWADWFAAHGVRSTRVLVCADKDSVVLEGLPAWAAPAPRDATDALLAQVDARLYVDTRPVLRAARAGAPGPLYLHTDSHWTALGAWHAYEALAAADARDGGVFAWLSRADLGPARLVPRAGGDLARMARVADAVSDLDVDLPVAPAFGLDRRALIAASGAPAPHDLVARVEAPAVPVRVVSPGARNRARLLWLRDSTGAALLPFLAATFADIIEVDRRAVTAGGLAELTQHWQPDAVLISVVERNARDDGFTREPPKP